MRSVIRFLNQEGVSPVEIHYHLTSMYGTVMNHRMSGSGLLNFRVVERVFMMRRGIDDALLKKIDDKFLGGRNLTRNS